MTKRSGEQDKENEEKHIVGIFDNISVKPEVSTHGYLQRASEREME